MNKNRFFRLICLCLIFGSLGSCKLGRYVWYNFADINDHEIFPARNLGNEGEVFTFPAAKQPKAPKSLTKGEQKIAFDDYLLQNETVAFLIIHNDSIQYEKYFDGYTEADVVPSFSMAKSVTSILIGAAIEDGLIESVEEPVTNYIPELNKEFEQVKIEHLLQMTSGLDFNEGYKNPFGHVATFYYGRNLRKAIPKLRLKDSPGKDFEYTSGSTQLLGLVLERALKDRSVSEYLVDKIWQPLGMEYDASWSLDREENGLEKTFCCINATARDYAKIGRLYLNKGNWNGKQIIPEEWVERSTALDSTNGSASYYQYQWWLPSENGDFMARGILGQYIYVNPNKNLVIVRLGRKQADVHWGSLFVNMAEGY